MPQHHPMDKLHEHLHKVAGHGSELHGEAADTVAARQAQAEQERQNGGNETLPPEGR